MPPFKQPVSSMTYCPPLKHGFCPVWNELESGMGKHTPEGRRRISEAARRNRPWRFSTGPRSAEGKAISRCNAMRHGFHLMNPGVEQNATRALVRLAHALVRFDLVTHERHLLRRLKDLLAWLDRCEELTPDHPFVRQLRESFGYE